MVHGNRYGIKNYFSMRKLSFEVLVIVVLFYLMGCCVSRDKSVKLVSPDSNININFFMLEDGSLAYTVGYMDVKVLDTSEMSFVFEGQPDLKTNLKVKEVLRNNVSEDWEMPWGEQRLVKNNYNEMIVKLQEKERTRTKIQYLFSCL